MYVRSNSIKIIIALTVFWTFIFQCSSRSQPKSKVDGLAKRIEIDSSEFYSFPDCFSEGLKRLILCYQNGMTRDSGPFPLLVIDSVECDCADFNDFTREYFPLIQLVNDTPKVVVVYTHGEFEYALEIAKLHLQPLSIRTLNGVMQVQAHLLLDQDFGKFTCDSIRAIDTGRREIPAEISPPRLGPLKVTKPFGDTD